MELWHARIMGGHLDESILSKVSSLVISLESVVGTGFYLARLMFDSMRAVESSCSAEPLMVFT